MSCYQVVLQGGHKVCRPVNSREEYISIRGTRSQHILADAVRKGEEDKKTLLTQFNYSCLPNEDGTLKGATSVSNSVGMDIDHIAPEKMQEVKERILAKKDELGLLMLERSARGAGYHLVFLRHPQLTQEENLRWASNLLGVEFDKAAKDITRVFFTTTDSPDDLIYLDDRLFYNSPCLQDPSPNLPRGGGDIAAATSAAPFTPPLEGTGEAAGEAAGEAFEATKESLHAFDLCVEQAGLKPDEMDIWGVHNWHSNLMAVLSVGVAKLMSREQLEAVIRQRLPNYSQTEDCRKLVDYFFKNYSADKGWMPKSLREINAQVQMDAKAAEEEAFDRFIESYCPPEMPEKLPRLILLPVKAYPEQYHPMLALTGSVGLAPHASHFRTDYLDGRTIGPGLFASVAASSGSGKYFFTHLLDHITLHTLQASDAQEWAKVRENQQLRDKMANAKDKPPRYKPRLYICETVSKTSMLDLQTNLGENGMILCRWPEADDLVNASRAQFSDISSMLRKAWDGEMARQYYLSDSSCSTQTRLNASVLLCGTPKAVLTRLFSDTENGMMQRFMPLIIPRQKRTFLPPRITPLSTDEQAELDGLIMSLWQKNLSLGEDTLKLEMPKTQEVVRQWYADLEEKYNNGLISEAEADLSHRVGQHMMRAAIPFVALYGEEQPEMLQYIRWLGDYVYYNICYIFSSRVAADMKESERLLTQQLDRRKTVLPLLQEMPEVFTTEQFIQARIARGQSANVRTQLSRYVDDGKLERLRDGLFKKIAA